MVNDSIYIALDFPNWKEAENFLIKNELQGVPVKVGMELFYREGPSVIDKLKANNHSIFLDLKLHDIPTTVMKAMRNLGNLEVDIVNVHALGGSDMIQAAKEGLLSSNKKTKLIAVTILTSVDEQTLNNELHIPGLVTENAVHFADFAKQNGADGVVCSVHEAKQIKEKCGSDYLTVTPGIRLENSNVNDQKRVATPKYAKENGSDILVIGRSITEAVKPRNAYERAVKELDIK
ncbi:orotidine-5'-phosphate decarboxylase [Oceanobacillus salinisoli]|uniref:orotidine-5'-phosphate decarboxylase n=1 Tax=Oceanobacillus salinisoli TaxID=2678611 RepID=UPI0012E0D810|nr:orotidine-5'-phosphate decarboxylase [Oceanobacillus salinisoli]